MTKKSHTNFTRQELYELVWCTPVHRLAAEFGISDVALAKYCRRQQIPLPSRGHWARKAAGQDVGQTALPELVRPDPPTAPLVQRPAPTKITACAIYLVGHGPRREPRLVELQLVRIYRYMDALAAKINEDFRLVETFVDLNWPRVNWWDPTDFPSFVRLNKALADKTFDTVFIDLESGDPRNWAPYDSIVPYLRHSGARVLNARYDDEDALKSEIGRKFGPSARESFFTGPDDASDIVAFFPALASAVALEAVDEDDRYDARWEPLLRDLRRLGDESPYASSGYPFIDPRLERKMIERKIKDEEGDRAKRRKAGELRFRIDRDSPPLLINEHAWGGEPRSEEQLQWAEARLVNGLGFRRLLEDSVVAYQKEIDGFTIFADPRQRGTIDFRVIRAVQASAGGKRTRKSLVPAYNTFKLPDAWKHDLPKKFEELARQHIRALHSGRAGA